MEERQMLLMILITVSGGFSDQIGPREEDTNLVREEGESVTLSCTYETNSNTIYLYCYTGSVRALHWYRQYAGSSPKFLILESYGAVTKADPPIAGVSIQNRKDNSSVDLKISSAAVTDSALYYCALEPTVRGNPQHAVQKAV
ncbi:hypothetical protein Q8A67_008908 [Cirrhinus molitorella]|uniref:Ig-like domain-containing protein n=1 Tax=Cirrhinus molitorella TaxID=172907 RepID=A0AA88PY88_9TELE|nr:hypothetical protein Q8A67_008908 [Cirrhinus molitorella]